MYLIVVRYINTLTYYSSFGIFSTDPNIYQYVAGKTLVLGVVCEKGLPSFRKPRYAPDMGYALGLAQLGGKHPKAKPWKGEGPGVFEIVEDYRDDTYRAVYTMRFANVVYVLHAFQKKSKSGIKTAIEDVRLIAERLP